MNPRLPLLIATSAGILLGASACRNSCQQVCASMRTVAEDDCGYVVSGDDFKACVQGQRGGELEDGDRAACRDFGSEDAIREEWSCEELADYFTGGSPAPSDDTGS